MVPVALPRSFVHTGDCPKTFKIMNFKFWSNKPAPSPAPSSSPFEQEVTSLRNAFETVAGLSAWVQRLTQEVHALQAILHKRGLLDEAEMRKTITEIMVGDHYSGGVGGFRGHTYFPFAQDEATFLKLRYGASEEDMKQFKESVEEASVCT